MKTQKLKHLLNKNKFNISVITLFIFILYSPSLLQHSMIWRADAYFHLSRIHDIDISLRSGHLPNLVNINSFGNIGQAINALYPIFSVLPLIWLTCWLTHITQYFAINLIFILIGSILNYFVFQKLKLNKIQSLVLTICITGLIDVYNFSSYSLQGAWATYFITPLIILSLLRINQNNKKYILILGMALGFVFNLHIISAGILSLFTLIFSIFLLVKSSEKFILFKQLSLSLLATLFFSLPSIITLITFSRNHLTRPIPFSLADQTVSLESMIHSLSNPTIYVYWSSVSPLQGILLIIDIFFLYNLRKFSKQNKYLISLVIVTQFIISPMFPWKLLDKTPISLLQFPARFLPILIIICLLVIFREHTFNNKYFFLATLLVSLAFSMTYTGNNKIFKNARPVLTTKQIENDLTVDLVDKHSQWTTLSNQTLNNDLFYKQAVYREYSPQFALKMPFEDARKSLIKNVVYINDDKVKNVKISTNVNSVKYSFNHDYSGEFNLPFWKYKNMNYTVKDQTGRKLPVSISNRNTILVNTAKVSAITIEAKNPVWYSLLTSVSYLFWVLALLILGVSKYSTLKKNRISNTNF